MLRLFLATQLSRETLLRAKGARELARGESGRPFAKQRDPSEVRVVAELRSALAQPSAATRIEWCASIKAGRFKHHFV